MDDSVLVEECYSLNDPYILAKHDETDSFRSVYNFPVNNAIDKQMQEIHTDKQNTYKFQIGIGIGTYRCKHVHQTGWKAEWFILNPHKMLIF